MNVNGHWQGEYVFAEADSDEAAADVGGTVVQFQMDLEQGWFGAVTGTVQDDARTGFPEQGKIKGKAKGSRLEFRRLMPVMRLMHEGNLAFEKWAERRKIVVDTEQPHPAILFEGALSENGKTIEGKWRMPSTKIDVPGSYMSLPMPAVGGTWKASRQ